MNSLTPIKNNSNLGKLRSEHKLLGQKNTQNSKLTQSSNLSISQKSIIDFKNFLNNSDSTNSKNELVTQKDNTRAKSIAILWAVAWVCFIFLTIVGGIFVISATMPSAVGQSGIFGFIFNMFKQVGFSIILGFLFGFIITRKSFTKRKMLFSSLIICSFAVGTQILLMFFGIENYGNKNWIKIPLIPFTIQPSEFLKLSIIMILALRLSVWKIDNNNTQNSSTQPILTRELKTKHWGKYFFYTSGIIETVIMVGLVVLISKDIGTALIMLIIALAIFFIANLPIKKFLLFLTIIIGLGAVLFMASANKKARLFAVIFPNNPAYCDPLGQCFQITQAKYAFANGGLFGVGLGGSVEKWGRLTQAESDFIYAIIGEEAGFFFCIILLILFVAIGFCLLKLSRTVKDDTAKIFIAGIAFWTTGQGLINMLMTLNLFPVIGVPMPFISKGGTAFIANAIGIMVALSLAKQEPLVQDYINQHMPKIFHINFTAISFARKKNN